jgi:hypothetical protein
MSSHKQLAISLLDKPPSTVALQIPLRPHAQLSPQPPACKASFTIDKPSWCVEPDKLLKLEDLANGRTFDVGSRPFYVIGRNEKASIVLENLCISRYAYVNIRARVQTRCNMRMSSSARRCHAALLHHTSGETYLMDLGSAHGTYVGQDRLVAYIPSLVRKGALIRYGVLVER